MLRSFLIVATLMVPRATPMLATMTGEDQPTPYLIDANTIAKIDCGKWMGTGSYIGNGLVVTARHVVSEGKCTADLAKADVVESSLRPGVDFALLRIKNDVAYRQLIDCSGIKEGRTYLASGYAEDAPRTVTQRLIGSTAITQEKGFEGETVMRGSITQGMSGGPVNDAETGALVAIINANSGDGITQALVLPLSKTGLCHG